MECRSGMVLWMFITVIFSLTNTDTASAVEVPPVGCVSEPCAANAECTNTPDSQTGNPYTCVCIRGYTGDGLTCDVLADACSSGNHACMSDSTCDQLDTEYNCTCNFGFFGDGLTSCDSICPSNSFTYYDGESCQICPCDTIGAMGCELTTGMPCNCHPGYTGPVCDQCVGENFIYTPIDGCRRAANFWDFGSGSDDLIVPPGENSGVRIVLPVNFLFGTSTLRRSATISTNGYIVFDNELPISPQLAALTGDKVAIGPFWATTDGRQGRVYYSIRQDAASRTRAGEMFTSLGRSERFSANISTVLVVTWVGMRQTAATGISQNMRNSFQAVVVTDGCVTFTVFYYDNTITWPNPQFPSDVLTATVFARDGNSTFFYDPESLFLRSTRREILIGSCPQSDSNFGILRECAEGTESIRATEPQTPAGECPSNPAIFNWLRNFSPVQYTQSAAGFRGCYANRFGQNLVCCYLFRTAANRTDSRNGALITTGAGASFARFNLTVRNFFTDLDLQDACCRAQMCDSFHLVRPRVTGIDVSLRISQLRGDPHITTLDGLTYTFNGLGEYRMWEANTAASRIVLQGRTAAVSTSSATVFSGFALGYFSQSGDLSPAVRVQGILSEYGSIHWLADGANITDSVNALESTTTSGSLPETNFPHGNFAVFTFDTETGETAVTLPNEISIGVRVIVGSTTTLLTVSVTVARAQLTGISAATGLLGNFNTNQTDDFVLRSGTMLEATSSERQLFSFGQSWQITAGESMFTYPIGLGGRDFSNPSHMPVFSDELSTANFSAAAIAQCGDDRECLFDSTETQDVGIGMETQRQGQAITLANTIVANVSPNITAVDRITASINSEANVEITVSDVGDTFSLALQGTSLPSSFSFNPPISGISFSTSYTGVLSFTPADTSTITMDLIATDSSEDFSVHTIVVFLCGCQNEQVCFPPTANQDGGNTSFVLLDCDCNRTYSGEQCQLDRNGCLDDAGCFSTVTCIDVPAPGVGAECGPCPVGLSGNGTNCDDINECTDGSHLCQPLANCTNTFGSYQCNCTAEFGCTDVNECFDNSDNCNNMLAVCANFDGGYNCTCVSGYTGNGVQCTDINECQPNQCLNGAECNNLLSAFNCTCATGFTGSLCESNIDDCSQSPCLNGGTCIDGINQYDCLCAVPHIGINCSIYQPRINLGTGLGAPYIATFVEESRGTAHISLSHRAAIDGNGQEICELNATLVSANSYPLDPEEFLFSTKQPRPGILLPVVANIELMFYKDNAAAVPATLDDWEFALANIEYLNTASEPSLANRQVTATIRLCSGLLSAPSVATIMIERIDDQPPLITLNLALPIPLP